MANIDLSHTVWPNKTSTAVTLNVVFRKRANQGIGTYETWAEMPSIVLVFNGINDSVTVEVLRQVVKAHLLNNNIREWWSPKNSDVAGEIDNVLSTSFVPPSAASSATTIVLFDGEFGPMLIS